MRRDYRQLGRWRGGGVDELAGWSDGPGDVQKPTNPFMPGAVWRIVHDIHAKSASPAAVGQVCRDMQVRRSTAPARATLLPQLQLCGVGAALKGRATPASTRGRRKRSYVTRSRRGLGA